MVVGEGREKEGRRLMDGSSGSISDSDEPVGYLVGWFVNVFLSTHLEREREIGN